MLRINGPSEPGPSRLSLLSASYGPFSVDDTPSSTFPLTSPLIASRSVAGTSVRYLPPAAVPSGCTSSRSLSSSAVVLLWSAPRLRRVSPRIVK